MLLGGEETERAILGWLRRNPDSTWRQVRDGLRVADSNIELLATYELKDYLVAVGRIARVDLATEDWPLYRLTERGYERLLVLTGSGEAPDREAREVAAV